MCEQTEISYLDGDVVWVKLGACWWPGQVTGFHNLPEDIQEGLKKKPLIAAVKFFQEDTYEFVKNYQQIYKYNCTLKEDFIKKGLDKYRIKSRDGSAYMDKFPGDVEMAEKLTGGDPEIITSQKFIREEKPDISSLFGEKKIPKKKRDRDEGSRERRETGNSEDTPVRKITHPRFLRESDHEVRIRHQPSSLPSTPTNSTGTPQYTCYVCNFTSSRLNVIILHNKTHSSGKPATIRSQVKTYSQSKSNSADGDTPKRKYVRKDKGETNKARKDKTSESGKRKYTKSTEKANKKKKPDPELREKLLADWEDESDNDSELNKSMDTCSFENSAKKSDAISEDAATSDQDMADDNEKIMAEADKILNETATLPTIAFSNNSPVEKLKISTDLFSRTKKYGKIAKKPRSSKSKKLTDGDNNETNVELEKNEQLSESEKSEKKTGSDKDDKKSRLSCFDFDEDDVPEPTIPPVRKIPRVFGDKNLSLKKEIIKEFEMSQARKNDQQKSSESRIGKDPAEIIPAETPKNLETNDQVTVLRSDTKAQETSTEVEVVEIHKIEQEDSTTDEPDLVKGASKMTQSSEISGDLNTAVTEHSIGDVVGLPTKKKETDADHSNISELESASTDTDKSQSTVTADDIDADGGLTETSETSFIFHKKRRGRAKQPFSSAKKNQGSKNDVKITESGGCESESTYKSENDDNHSLSLKKSDGDAPTKDSQTEYSNLCKKVGSPSKSSKSDNLLLDFNRGASNDDSQSEIDEQSSRAEEKHVEPVKKSRRGRKALVLNSKTAAEITETSVRSDGKSSESIDESSDENNRPDEFVKTRETGGNLDDGKKKLSDINETKQKSDSRLSHINEKSAAAEPPKSNAIIEKGSASPKKSTEKSSKTHEISSEVAPLRSDEDTPGASRIRTDLGDAKTKTEYSPERKKIQEFKIEEPIGSALPESKVSENMEVSKISFDILPPKKSQIKKFESSQIDFFDVSASVKKSVIHPEPEKRIDKVEEMEIEITRDALDAEATETFVEKTVKEEGLTKLSQEVTLSKDLISEIIGDVIPKKTTDKPSNVPEVTIERDVPKDVGEAGQTQTTEQGEKSANLGEKEQQSDTNELEIELVAKEPSKSATEIPQRSLMQTRYKGKFIPETGTKAKKEKDGSSEEKPVNTFQEAFLKTLQIDNLKSEKKMVIDEIEITVGRGKKVKKATEKKSIADTDSVNVVPVPPSTSDETVTETVTTAKKVSQKHQEEIPESDTILNVAAVSDFTGVEVVVDENIETQIKTNEELTKETERSSSETTVETADTPSTSIEPTKVEDISKMLSLDLPKSDEMSRHAVSTPSPTSESSVLLKKREKPRIIENVSLKEPMHILKSKLLEKLPPRGMKHKLETESPKRGEPKNSPRSKMMKFENSPSNTKSRQGSNASSSHLSLTKKLEALKAEEAVDQQVISQSAQAASSSPVTEKLIQQSSQSLADMELDIDSMPFVLSEDVLTPESMEQIPVVITSIIPSSTPAATSTSSMTPTTTQITPSTQTHSKKANEPAIETTPSKKKSGTPAILKNKGKAKPTITSVKTIVPPLTGSVKSLKFQNAQAGKPPPMISQKGTSGKYVIVQTAAGQQLRYSVQGKPGTQQKIAIPAGKSPAVGAQLVQQGGKVVILTSPQSGQTKMIPLNTTKTLGGKVQRIVTSKGQIFTPLNPQSVITSKTIIAPKTDVGSPTTSKLTGQGQKMITTQGLLSSKGILTQIPGTISKSALLSGTSQGIITKGGIYTPISASLLAGKTIISSKTLVTSKGTTILSPLTSQGLVTSKGTILAPISQALTGKTILSAQGIVSSKGTVLTPITGQQVKAIAAKTPTKSGKVQYQAIQQKMQLPVLQKSQKIPMSSSQMRVIGSLKSPGSTILLQNTVTGQKTLVHGKKVIKQAIAQQQSTTPPPLAPQSSSVQVSPSVPPQNQHARGKAQSTVSGVQKIVMPKTAARQQKSQQKIIVQKIHDASAQGSPSKSAAGLTNVSRTVPQQRQPAAASSSATTKASAKSYAGVRGGQQKRNILNAAMNSINPPLGGNVSVQVPLPLSLPALEQIDTKKKAKEENKTVAAVPIEEPKPESSSVDHLNVAAEKIDEPKVATQPQIMALPTESGDGTQTYVLVTIDEQGQIQPLDNNTLMSLEGTTQNPDGTRTLYIDPSSLGDAGTLDNIVLQFDNGSALPPTSSEPARVAMTESFPSSEIIQTSNQDILAAALANTDFQQEIGLPENPTASVMTTGLTQTSLINQTILQSTIIPPTEPISSAAVLETSLTLNQPIMTPLEVPSNLPIQAGATTSVVPTIPSSLELPLTITNPSISYITSADARIQIPGNSMPDIGEIMETSSEIERNETPVTSQYLVVPTVEENDAIKVSDIQPSSSSVATVSYSVSITDNMLDTTAVQTTPSMPIIDDTFADDVQYGTTEETTLAGDQSFADVPVSEMLVSKASVPITAENTVPRDVTVSTEMVVSSQGSGSTVSGQEEMARSPNESTTISQDTKDSSAGSNVFVPREMIPVTTEELKLPETVETSAAQFSSDDMPPMVTREESVQHVLTTADESGESSSMVMHVEEHASEIEATSMPLIEETCMVTSESNTEEVRTEHPSSQVPDSGETRASTSYEMEPVGHLDQLPETSSADDKPSSDLEQRAASSNHRDRVAGGRDDDELPEKSFDAANGERMEVDQSRETEIFSPEKGETLETSRVHGLSPRDDRREEIIDADSEINFEEAVPETSEDTPSQSYKQFDTPMASDSLEIPSQSANKSENSREPTQSIAYDSMEIDESSVSAQPPTQSFEDSKQNEATQSYETSIEIHGNAPTQSYNEIMHNQDDRNSGDELGDDDQSFPTQSYEVEKMESLSENMETDAETSQEGNIPSQSNDIGTDGIIGTSSVFANNSGANEDETASSSYVPETPETQERDQDQESAISTSSYEIPPCEELNIASSSVIPDTSVRDEHSGIHDNGVPEIPTSSYNLNPDSSSAAHVDAVPTSSYEDQVILEQNVSTSYEVPISMPGLEENSSQSFVTESTDHRNEPTSYYTHHQEVTASYYESVHQESNSRLEEDAQEEVTASYYESNPQDIASEASQSYFAPEEATPSYSNQSISPSYYDPRPESEATQSFYSSSQSLDRRGEQASSQNVEASQSFYPEVTENLRLRQQGEATPTYSARYPVDYTLTNSPIERHDLVESSVPATRPTER